MVDWIEFMDKYLCEEEAADCERAPGSEIHFLRPLRFYLFDPSWSMMAELFREKTTKRFREKLLDYDDWSNETQVLNTTEMNPSFWALDAKQRQKPLNYTY